MNFFARKWRQLKWALTPAQRKHDLLEGALGLLRLFPDTRELLELASREGITIKIAGNLAGTGVNGHLRHEMKSTQSFIELAPRATSEELAETLIHELRHVWQAKVMGITAANVRSEEGGAELSTIITRVQEADAFAFTHVLIGRINEACASMIEANKMVKELMTPGGELSEENAAKITRHFAEKAAKLPDPRDELAERFLFMLKVLKTYELGAMERYHILYTHPLTAPSPHAAESVDIPRLRRILRAGTTESAPAYLDNLDDAGFCETVMKDVDSGVREALKLMDDFERAAAKGLPANDNQALRQDIHRHVKAAAKKVRASFG